MKKQTVIILSMHRSGTSAMAGVFQILGYDLGGYLLPGDKYNEKGYYENAAVGLLNDEILPDALGINWQTPLILKEDWHKDEKCEKYREKIRLVIADQFEDGDKIVIKDPRLAFLLPLWSDVLKENEFELKYIIPVRSPQEIANSLARRNGFTNAHSTILWMNHMLEIERLTRSETRVFVNYDALLTNPEAALQRINHVLQLNCEAEIAQKAGHVKEFLDQRLQHHKQSKTPEETHRFYGALTGQLFESLKCLAEDTMDAPEHLEKIGDVREQHLTHLRFFYNQNVEDRIVETKAVIARLTVTTNTGETHNLSRNVSIDADRVEFSLLDLGVIEELVFYPAKEPCVMRFAKIVMVSEDGSMEETDIVASSKHRKYYGSLLFYEDAPYIVIGNTSKKAIRTISIFLKYLSVGDRQVGTVKNLMEDRIRMEEFNAAQGSKTANNPDGDTHNERNITTVKASRRWLLWQFAKTAARHPLKFIRNINATNIGTLKRALLKEDPLTIRNNLRKLHGETGNMATTDEDKPGSKTGNQIMGNTIFWWNTGVFSDKVKQDWDINKEKIKNRLKADGYYAGDATRENLIFEQIEKSYARNPEYYKEYKENHPITPAVKAMAFYLPQYHRIDENDTWWGEGFTDWTNVSKAAPRFKGHYQPRMPGKLGFYDLSKADTLRQQVELAKNYGIHGFCFHYYWFSGKRLLEKPMDHLIESDLDFPFCICWANENWSRRWDGSDRDILIEQGYRSQDPALFVNDLSRYLKDSRYIKINGRHVIIVYRAHAIPDVRGVVKAWKKEFEKLGFKEPLLVCAQTFGLVNPASVGFDAAVEFPPHEHFYQRNPINGLLNIFPKDYAGLIRNYDDALSMTKYQEPPEYDLIKSVFPSWDNSARKKNKGQCWAYSTPKKYGEWLRLTADYMLANPVLGENYMFVNAWNEWAEGAYLEPDRHFGYAYLEETYSVLKDYDQKK